MTTKYSQRYGDAPSSRKDKGNMTTKSIDIARAVVMSPELSYRKLAVRFGVSPQRVGQVARRLNVARFKKAGMQEE